MKQAETHRTGIPITRVHPNDLKVLENVLNIYLLYLRRSNGGDTRIRVMQRLHQRLKTLLSSSQSIEGTCILFSEQELQAIHEALPGYMSLLCQIIPPSPQRNEVLECLQGLHLQFAAMLSAYLN
ncbi:MAG TPA: hypothetical protein VFQ36_09750 [Ktedonobacteraceae bacterium]|nr:hypothetical protein [Ktedonobacteraceae bacterium]